MNSKLQIIKNAFSNFVNTYDLFNILGGGFIIPVPENYRPSFEFYIKDGKIKIKRLKLITLNKI